MSSAESLVFLNKPNGYVSENVKQIISDFFELEKSGSFSYAYQYLNGSYYSDLAYAICIWIAIQNIMDVKECNLERLEIGETIIYHNEYYTFQGRDTDSEDCYTIESVYEKGNLTVTVPKGSLENGITIVTGSKRREPRPVRQDLADFLGIEKFGRNNDRTIIILMERKKIDKLLDTDVRIGNVVYKFDEVCSSIYLKDDVEKTRLPKMNSVEVPMIIFSSSPRAIAEYLVDMDEEPRLRLFAIGDKWLKGNQINDLINLEDICREFEIPVRLYASVSMVMTKEAKRLIDSMEEEYCWLDPLEDKTFRFSYHFIENNENFKDFANQLQDSLNKFKLCPDLKYLDKLLRDFLKLKYNLTTGKSSVLDKQLHLIMDYLEKKKFIEFDYLKNILRELYVNRFGFDVAKKIKQIRRKGTKCALIVIDAIVTEASEHYKDDDQMTILAYSNEISEDLYEQFDQAILLSPFPSNRRKWLLSNFCAQVDILVPRLQENYLSRSLSNDKSILEWLYDEDFFGQNKEGSPYLQSINAYFDDAKRVASVRSTSETDSETYMELFDSMDRQDTQSFAEVSHWEDYDNSIVDVESQYDLESGCIIWATKNGKVFILEADNTVRRIDTEKLKLGQMVIEFSIPYSDDFYRKHLKAIYNKNTNTSALDQLPVDGDEYHDYLWKSELLNYVRKENLNPQKLKEKIERLGFPERSVQFYKNWSSIDSIQMLPHNREFIKFVGQMIGNSDIANHYEKYATASEAVKKRISEIREQVIEGIDGNPLEKVISLPIIIEFKVDTIINIHQILKKDVPRYSTNKIINQEC